MIVQINSHLIRHTLFSQCSIVRQSPSSTRERAECAFWPGQVWWALIVRTVLMGRGFQPPNFDTSRSIALCLNRLQNHWQTPASALPEWHWRHGALLTQTERVRDWVHRLNGRVPSVNDAKIIARTQCIAAIFLFTCSGMDRMAPGGAACMKMGLWYFAF